MDVITLLKDDHRWIEALFKDFEDETGLDHRLRLAREMCHQLRLHTQLEEDEFYPAADEIPELHGRVVESLREHDQMNDVMARIEAIEGAYGLRSSVEELAHAVRLHVREEEHEFFRDVGRS